MSCGFVSSASFRFDVLGGQFRGGLVVEDADGEEPGVGCGWFVVGGFFCPRAADRRARISFSTALAESLDDPTVWAGVTPDGRPGAVGF